MNINDLPNELLAFILRPEEVGIDASFVCKQWCKVMLEDTQWKEVEKKMGMPLFPHLEELSLIQNIKLDWKNKTELKHKTLTAASKMIVRQMSFPVPCKLRHDQEAIFENIEKRNSWEVARCTMIAWHAINKLRQNTKMVSKFMPPSDSARVDEFIIEISRIKFAEFLQNRNECDNLNLSGCTLTSLPDLRAFQKITSLDLSTNFLTKLPEWISLLIHLTALDLNHNFLRDFPEAIRPLKRLTALDIGSNPLLNFPNFSATFPELEVLSLGGGMFSKFPEGIDSQKLKRLAFQNCLVDTIPVSIKTLSLTKLCLRSMHLKFPEAALSIKTLVELDLNDNEIELIPEDIISLSKLRKLSMGRNKLSALPIAFETMTELKDIYLVGNLIQTVSDRILSVSDRYIYLDPLMRKIT